MEIKIEWLKLSEKQLKAIFDFYAKEANTTVAHKIINKIIKYVETLKHQPLSGQIEPLLKNRSKEYRYLVCDNYKILYFFNQNKIIISSVFDCRMNPVKMRKLK